MQHTFYQISLLLIGGILAATQLEAQVPTNSNPRDQLQQLTAQLQKSPDDQALREKIIALAKTITPAPALPDEAERRKARGAEAFREAKSVGDYQNAVKEFQQAALAAPWSGEAYFNLGLAQDKAEDFEGSLRSLKLAQLASPDSKDIKDLYYKVEYQRDKAAEQNSAAAKEAAEQQRIAAQQAAVYQGLDGGIWTFKEMYYNNAPMAMNAGLIRIHTRLSFEVHGHEIEYYEADDLNARARRWHTTFASRQFQAVVDNFNFTVHIAISDDGQSITQDSVGSDGIKSRSVYQRVN